MNHEESANLIPEQIQIPDSSEKVHFTIWQYLIHVSKMTFYVIAITFLWPFVLAEKIVCAVLYGLAPSVVMLLKIAAAWFLITVIIPELSPGIVDLIQGLIHNTSSTLTDLFLIILGLFLNLGAMLLIFVLLSPVWSMAICALGIICGFIIYGVERIADKIERCYTHSVTKLSALLQFELVN